MSNEEAERFMEWVKSRAPQPKREWVGLSEKDFEVLGSNYGFDGVCITRTVENLLRGKNNG